jgi:F-type H+-transporting ATPase subunit b
MPQLDYTSFPSQIFWLVVAFGILYVVLTKMALPGVREVLQTRQDRIAGDLNKADAAQKEAEKIKATYTGAMEQSRQKAQQLMAEATAAIQKTTAARQAELDATLTRTLEKAEREIVHLRTEAIAALEPVTAELSQAIIEKLLHKTSGSSGGEETVVKNKTLRK